MLMLNRGSFWCVAVACLAASPRPLLAQGTAQIVVSDTLTARIGDRVRVNVAGRSPDPTGRLTRITADSLWVRADDSWPPTVLARETVQRVELSRGVPGRARRGWIGAGVVGVAGGVVGAMLGRALTGSCGDCSSSSRGAWIGGGIGGAVGAGIGAFFGSAGGRERWVVARLPDSAPAGARENVR